MTSATPIKSRSLSLLCLSLLFLSGCAGCVGASPVEDAGPPSDDAGSDAGRDCPVVAIGDVGIDVQFDVETVYSASVESPLGTAASDDLVFNFVNINERFGDLAVGTFSLSEEPNDNRGTCAECISIFVDQLSENSEPAKVLFQAAGSITLETNPRTGTFKGRVEGLELVEVEIDMFTLESTPVPNGDCVRIDDFDVDFKYVPAEWTCDADLYDSGGMCNCSCGAFDPDCGCDPFAEECPDVIEDDCSEGTVCTFEGCKASCDIFSEPAVPCPAGELCSFDLGVQICIAAPGRVHNATVGQPCTGESDFVQYCDIENTLPKGMCDHFNDTCQPVCDDNATCGDGETCYTVAGGPPGEGGLGYCRPEE